MSQVYEVGSRIKTIYWKYISYEKKKRKYLKDKKNTSLFVVGKKIEVNTSDKHGWETEKSDTVE